MKNQIRILSLIVFTILSLTALGQSFGIKGGLNISNLKFEWEDNSSSETYDNRFGFHIGLTTEFGKGNFKLAPEFLFSTRGCVIDADPGGAFKMYYLDIPINLKYKYDMGTAKVFGQIGPYLGIALSGTSEINGQDDTKMTFGSDADNDYFKRTDIGMGFGAGLEFNKLSLCVSYSFSLTNMLPYDTETCKSKVLAVSVGYKF